VAVLEKIFGAWPLIIWEAKTAKRNYYRTKTIEKKTCYLGVGQDLGLYPGPNVEPPLLSCIWVTVRGDHVQCL